MTLLSNKTNTELQSKNDIFNKLIDASMLRIKTEVK